MDPLLIIALIIILESVFLFPIKDRRLRERGFPWMTAVLIGVNVVVHVSLLLVAYSRNSAWPDDKAWLEFLYPAMDVADQKMGAEGLGALSSLTSFFLHANASHLLGNMFYLWFFGRKIEDAAGPLRLCLFYLLCGFAASFVSVLANATLSPLNARVPSLGASGAISGLMGAYLFLYSDQKIMTLISTWLGQIIAQLSGICFIALPIPIWIPAWVFLVHAFLRDALMAQLIVEAANRGIPFSPGVGVFAHLGGALTGMVVIYFFVHPDVLARRR